MKNHFEKGRVGREGFMVCKTNMRYMTYASLAGATNSTGCKLCEAGLYGSGSGEGSWISARGGGGEDIEWNRVSNKGCALTLLY